MIQYTRTYEMTEADVAAAARAHFDQGLRKPFSIVVLLVVAGIWVAAIVGLSGGSVVRNVLTAVALAALWMVLFRASVIRMSRREFKQQKTLHEVFTVEITPECFLISSRNGHSVIPWREFFGWLERGGNLLLYHGPRLYNILPDRLFATVADREEVVRRLRDAGVRRL